MIIAFPILIVTFFVCYFNKPADSDINDKNFRLSEVLENIEIDADICNKSDFKNY